MNLLIPVATQPDPTRCPSCGTVAAEIVCHLCKTVRPFWQQLADKAHA